MLCALSKKRCPLRRKAVEVDAEKQIRVIVHNGRQVVVGLLGVIYHRVAVGIVELYLVVLEVEQGGGIRGVVHRPNELHLQVALHPLAVVFRDGEEKTALYLLVGCQRIVAEARLVHIGVETLLQRLEHAFVGTLYFLGIDLDSGAKLLCGSA